MKHLAIALLAFPLCSCGFMKTNEVAAGAATPVPADRLLMSRAAAPGMATFTIARDTGYLGGGCFLGVEIDRKLAARFDTGESATFSVTPGRVELSVVGDPIGGGLCGVGFTAVRARYDLTAGKPIRFRLSSRQYRRPELESNDIEAIDDDVESTPVASARPIAPVPVPVANGAPAQAPSVATQSGAALAAPASDRSSPVALQRAAVKGSGPREAKYQFSAEALAKTRQCTARPEATLVASAPGSETYAFRCDGGTALIERCDFGNCRVLE